MVVTRMNSREILDKLVSFDTVSRNSNLPLLDWVEAYLSTHGIEPRRVFDETGQKANLWATIGPSENLGYILSGHTDVVPVDGQDWSSDPFQIKERNGHLYGRGTADMKGFVACVLAAVPAMARAELSQPIHLAFSYDEEVGCVGVRTLLDDLKSNGQSAAGAIIGEPTGMEVVVGHKGKRGMICEVTGKSAHSSLAPQGVNAVDYASRVIIKIRDMADELAAKGERDPLFDIPHSTGHTGTIQGGAALNIVPEYCRFEFEFRTIASDDYGQLISEVEAYARDELEPKMKAVSPETGFKFTEKAEAPGLETDPDADVVTLAKNLAGKNSHAKVAYGTEAGLFTNYLDIPCVVCGPGHIAQAHKPDEFIAIDQLAACDQFLGRLVQHSSR
ncbi:MAG: acetylornithine deacetylase [Pseudomonadota bacterium]